MGRRRYAKTAKERGRPSTGSSNTDERTKAGRNFHA
jgi:hypothetical protein